MPKTPNHPVRYIDAADTSTDPMASHLNAVRDIFTGQLTVMDRHDRVHYNKFCSGIVECLKPANALETQLAQSIAADYWRLNRLRALEEGIFSLLHANPMGDSWNIPVDEQIANSRTQAFLQKRADFKFLSQYEMRVQRALNHNKAELKQVQADRVRFDAQPDRLPDDDGFAFSNRQPEILEPELEVAATEAVTLEPAKTRTAIHTDGFEFSKSPNAGAKPGPEDRKPGKSQGSIPIRLAS